MFSYYFNKREKAEPIFLLTRFRTKGNLIGILVQVKKEKKEVVIIMENPVDFAMRNLF